LKKALISEKKAYIIFFLLLAETPIHLQTEIKIMLQLHLQANALP